MKITTNKWDLAEVKSLCTGKTHTQTYKMITEWEKILANDVTKGLVSKIYKQLIQLNIRKQNKTHTTKKQTIFQRRYTDGQEAHEKMLSTAN